LRAHWPNRGGRNGERGWLDAALGENAAVRHFLRFHTGAKLTARSISS
jgi:alpha-D-ribose 1-methylphosphonate 5-triphosphate synthase subunit PhnH